MSKSFERRRELDIHAKEHEDMLLRMASAEPFLYIPNEQAEKLPETLDEALAMSEAKLAQKAGQSTVAVEYKVEKLNSPYSFTARRKSRFERVKDTVARRKAAVVGAFATGLAVFKAQKSEKADQPYEGFIKRHKAALAGAALGAVALFSLNGSSLEDTQPRQQDITASFEQPFVVPPVVESEPKILAQLDVQPETSVFIESAYEEDFELSLQSVLPTYTGVKELISEAEQEGKITSISITGLASAEDESEGEGLQTASSLNEQLALERANLVEDTLINNFNVDPSLITTQAEEQSFEDYQLDIVSFMAENLGYESPGQLVEAFNDGLVTDSTTQSYLQNLLGSHRGVKITIETDASL